MSFNVYPMKETKNVIYISILKSYDYYLTFFAIEKNPNNC